MTRGLGRNTEETGISLFLRSPFCYRGEEEQGADRWARGVSGRREKEGRRACALGPRPAAGCGWNWAELGKAGPDSREAFFPFFFFYFFSKRILRIIKYKPNSINTK